LVSRLDEFECQGQRSRSPLTKNEVFGRYRGNCWMDLRQIHTEDMFGPLLAWVWRSRSVLAACVRFMFGKTSLL